MYLVVIVKRYLRETSFCKQKFLAGKRLSQASGFDETDLTRSEAGLLYQNDGGGQGGDGDGVAHHTLVRLLSHFRFEKQKQKTRWNGRAKCNQTVH